MRNSVTWRYAHRIVLALPLGLASMAHAQTPAALPNVELVDLGEIQSIAVQPHLGVLAAGSFTQFDGVARNGLARVHAGAVDPNWNPNPSWLSATPSVPRRVTMAPDGGVFVSGDLVEIAGHAVDCIAKLKPDGELDTAWSAPTTNCDFEPVFDRQGWVYYIDSDAVVRRTRLDIGGSADSSWEHRPPTMNVTPYKLLLESSNSLYVASLDSYYRQTRVARVALTNSGVERWGQMDLYGKIVAMQQSEEGKLFAAYADGSIRTFDVRFGMATTVLEGQASNLRDMKLFEDGWQQLLFIADASGVRVVEAFNGQPVSAYPVSAGGTVNRLVVADAGRLLAAGKFSAVGNVQSQSLAQVIEHGPGPAPSYQVRGPGQVSEVVMQPNGGAIVRGSFVTADRQPRKGLFRLTSAGQVDPNWIAQVDGAIEHVAVNANNDVYVAGSSLSVAGNPMTVHLAKLDGASGNPATPSWSADSSFASAPSDIAVDAQDRLYVAPSQQQSFYGVRRILPVNGGETDSQWSALLNLPITGVDVIGDYAYLRSSAPQQGSQLNRVSLQTGAAVDWSWQLSFWNPLYTPQLTVVKGDGLGNILVGGRFEAQTNTGTQSHLVRYPANASPAMPDESWRPQLDGPVSSIAVDALGEVFVAGDFRQVGGQANPGLVKLSPIDASVRSDWTPVYGARSLCVADAQRLFVIGDAWRNTLVALPLTASNNGSAPGPGLD